MARQEFHRLLGLFFPLLGAWLGLTVPAMALSPPQPPATGAKLADFVPKGWALLMEAEGDLNRDGKADAALILKSEAEESREEDWPRLLVLLIQNPAGGYRLSATSENAVLCRHCGGVYGDPLAGLQIKNGVVIVDHYAGSSHRWGYTHRWRQQDGNWVLIGETSISHNTLSSEAKEEDVNLLTGDKILKVTDENGRTRVTKSKLPKQPLKTLTAFKL